MIRSTIGCSALGAATMVAICCGDAAWAQSGETNADSGSTTITGVPTKNLVAPGNGGVAGTGLGMTPADKGSIANEGGLGAGMNGQSATGQPNTGAGTGSSASPGNLGTGKGNGGMGSGAPPLAAPAR